MSKARDLIRDALVWDQLFPATETCGDMAAHGAMLARMRAAGFDATTLTMAYDPEDGAEARRRIAAWREFVTAHPDQYRLLLSPDDALAARAEGQMAIGFHLQGSTPFQEDLGQVQALYDLGVRAAILAYNRRNAAACGCHETPDTGLSDFGRDLVAEMQRVGMMVDLSHGSYRTAWDACEVATRPIFLTHGNPTAVWDHPRNFPDDLARAIAATGGVIGVCGVGLFLGPAEDLTEPLFRAVDHWVQVVGPDKVGLGLDIVSDEAATIAGMARVASHWPADAGYDVDSLQLMVPEDLERLVSRMLAAGYDEATCRGILGENWLRAAREAWRPA